MIKLIRNLASVFSGNDWMPGMTKWDKFQHLFGEAKYVVWSYFFHLKHDTLLKLKWPTHNYNRVKLHGVQNAYRDYDEQILYFAFQIFEDFWNNHFAVSYLHESDPWATTAQELYDWWQKRKIWAEDDIDEKDDEMLAKLMKIRGHLWI